MSNSKISALTSASTVVGTEVLPIVQSSATVKVAISDLNPGLSTITAAKGGTGQTSYAVGDLLYANTTTTLAKLADVATGNALISGGIGVAPSYGKIGLTTHVSGVLPVANGGTNASSASITAFNNITGYTASGATGTTSTNLVFSTSPSITTPRIITSINDNNGNELFGVTATASAVNELTVANAVTGNNPVVSATGSDTNIGITLTPKGTGNLVLTSGNLTVANGQGIDFSATAGTGTSELLADYEEGTWTPNLGRLTGGSITTTYTSRNGYYTKIGNLVTVTVLIEIGVITLQGTSLAYIDGLPFTPIRSNDAVGVVSANTGFATVDVATCVANTAPRIYFRNAGRGAALSSADFSSAGTISATLQYMTS